MEGFFGWIDSLLIGFQSLWEFLITPLSNSGYHDWFTTPLTIISVGSIGAILALKSIHMINVLS